MHLQIRAHRESMKMALQTNPRTRPWNPTRRPYQSLPRLARKPRALVDDATKRFHPISQPEIEPMPRYPKRRLA
ncbi:MAG: hypothetical protein EAZ65_05775 [Verrucomicrobia bacterium]|nr:MAG: hypothetical protein EAZ84_01320 [Verrucomicrobiota bacterium]TAE87813.1 MAG: hypothetical protein EAZ82_06250 [Verrucomicrobiota bacterium]TAF25556.1 MAG: hypothetical protein EAZ71_07175 [Verrucomicrobiota bacterium]TAF41377.1 MAG: hypothetical protein EAZ65_05775 [Verrucomicrobiota bacterium]